MFCFSLNAKDSIDQAVAALNKGMATLLESEGTSGWFTEGDQSKDGRHLMEDDVGNVLSTSATSSCRFQRDPKGPNKDPKGPKRGFLTLLSSTFGNLQGSVLSANRRGGVAAEVEQQEFTASFCSKSIYENESQKTRRRVARERERKRCRC